MKKALFLVWLGLLSFYSTCQVNLVPNPSFEQYVTCPNGQAQIHYSTGWLNFSYSPDYFNSCSSNFSIPYNMGGYQYPATGNAYSGIYTYE